MSEVTHVEVRPTNEGSITWQIYVRRLHPKLAIDRSHYLLADERRRVPVTLSGKEREAIVMVKIWAPIPRKEREEEASRKLMAKIKRSSPRLM